MIPWRTSLGIRQAALAVQLPKLCIGANLLMRMVFKECRYNNPSVGVQVSRASTNCSPSALLLTESSELRM